MLLCAIFSLPASARNFTYTYEGLTLVYTVLDENAKTCKTPDGYATSYGGTPYAKPGNAPKGSLTTPAIAKDGEIEYTVTEIGSCGFITCYDLTAVVIPNSVTTIGDYAFQWCTSLRFVIIPASATSFGGGSFSLSNNLRSVYYEAEHPISAYDDIFEDAVYNDAILYVAATAIEKCKNLEPWKYFIKLRRLIITVFLMSFHMDMMVNH